MVTALLAVVLFCSPTTSATQSSEVADLRRIIDGLRKQVADLRAENAQLTHQLHAASTQASKQPRADQNSTGKIAVGMTMSEVEHVLNNKGVLQRASGATKVYFFQVAGTDAAKALETGWQNTEINALVTATFADDKLVAYSVRSEH